MQPDATFWQRQNSCSPAYDLPHITAAPTLPDLPPLELIISAPSGKLVYHFSYPKKTRVDASVLSLSAALVAYQATTKEKISLITIPRGLVLSTVIDIFHIHVSSRDRRTPPHLLHTLSRAAVIALMTALSGAFSPHLRTNPSFDPASLGSSLDSIIDVTLKDALTYPLPYALHAPVSLPALSAPRNSLSRLLHRVYAKCSNVEHALVLTASPPFPHCIVASVSSANNPLRDSDLLLINACAPRRADDIPLVRRLYLQSHTYHRGFYACFRAVQLRLDPDDYEDFKRQVGRTWTPEWTSAGGDVVWVVALANDTSDCEKFLNMVNDDLDRHPAAKDLMVSMERPWTLMEISEAAGIIENDKQFLKAVVVIERHRVAGSMGAFEHNIGIVMVSALVIWDQDPSLDSLNIRREGQIMVVTQNGFRIVVVERRFLLCFDDQMEEYRSLKVSKEQLAPYLNRITSQLIPHDEKCTVEPPTPLANFLIPFRS